MSDKRNENTDKKGTCVYEKDIHVRNENTDKKGTCVYKKDIHVSYKGQGADLLRCLLKQTFLV